MDEPKIILDYGRLKTISSTIKKLTHSGFQKIEVNRLREIFDICQVNSGYVEHAFTRIMVMLKENHSEVRLGAVLLCHHFFENFASFRSLLINSFDTYFKFTFGEKFNQNLPLPKEAAALVIKTTIKNLELWFHKYGKDYQKLKTTYIDFKNEKCVDFENLEIYNKLERAKKEKQAAESLKINTSLLEKSNKEINGIESDIINSLTTIQTCFDLLIEFPENDNAKNFSDNSADENLRLHGVFKPYQNVEINLNTKEFFEIKVNDENSAIIDNAKEMFSLINKKYLPKVKAWKILLEKVGGNDELLYKSRDLENQLENAVGKFNKLKFIDSVQEECVSTDSELEEVEEETQIREKVKVEKEKELFEELPDKRDIPSTSKVEACPSKVKELSERKRELLKIAPKIPFGADLYNWEENKKPTELILPTAVDGHRFWASSSIDSIEVPAESASLRVIEFSGEFEPVTRACKAPLPSGKLCPRHDRVKCPFHGTIVPRDDTGQIINKEDEELVRKSKPEINTPDWQDPKLLAELKASTGLDLKIGKKRKKVQNPGLTDINKKKKETSYDKISKKIFKSSTLKKVNKTLDKLDYKRHRDKYGDQFNYVHGS